MDTLEQSLFLAALESDKVWHEALEDAYGSRAVEARYNRALNAATPTLKALHSIREQAHEAWMLCRRLIRKEILAA